MARSMRDGAADVVKLSPRGIHFFVFGKFFKKSHAVVVFLVVAADNETAKLCFGSENLFRFIVFFDEF